MFHSVIDVTSSGNKVRQWAQPMEPRRLPQRLPGSLWCVTAYFNPCGHSVWRKNFSIFHERLLAQGTQLLTVELAIDDQPFELTDLVPADRLIQLRTGTVLYHQQALLNIAFRALPDECDKVAWLDCDMLFDDADWWVKTAALLEQYALVQPYAYILRLKKGELPETCSRELRIGFKNGQAIHGIVCAFRKFGPLCLSRQAKYFGARGGAWAGRRSLLLKHGLYPYDIVGGGDVTFAKAVLGLLDSGHQIPYSPAMAEHVLRWQRAFAADAEHSVSFTPGVALHLYHGDLAQRGYDWRRERLCKLNFDPLKDVALNDQGVLMWNNEKPELHQFLNDYFVSRKESE